jgi:hypothetical protein
MYNAWEVMEGNATYILHTCYMLHARHILYYYYYIGNYYYYYCHYHTTLDIHKKIFFFHSKPTCSKTFPLVLFNRAKHLVNFY